MKSWFGLIATAVALLVPRAAGFLDANHELTVLRASTVIASGRPSARGRGVHHAPSIVEKVRLDPIVAAAGILHAPRASLGGEDYKNDGRGHDEGVGVHDDVPGPYTIERRFGFGSFDVAGDPAGVPGILGTRGAANVRVHPDYMAATETMRYPIAFGGVQLDGKAPVGPRLSPGARLLLRDPWDRNDLVRIRGDLPYAVVLSPVRWGLGYRQEYTASRGRRVGNVGPDEQNSFQGFSFLSHWRGEQGVYAEVFGGTQRSSTGGNHNTDQFLGAYSEALLRRVGPYEFSVTGEGGDYTLGSTSEFHYYQFGFLISRTF